MCSKLMTGIGPTATVPHRDGRSAPKRNAEDLSEGVLSQDLCCEPGMDCPVFWTGEDVRKRNSLALLSLSAAEGQSDAMAPPFSEALFLIKSLCSCMQCCRVPGLHHLRW